MKKKLLLVVPSLGIGGQERIAVNTAIGLQDYFDIDIVIFQDDNSEQYEAPCNLINLNIPTKKGVFSKIANQLHRSIKLCLLRNKKKCDYVISFGKTANLSNALSGICGKGKTISGIHGFAEVKRSIILSAILKLSDKVICITHAMQAGLLNLYPGCRNSVVIENGYILDDTEVMNTSSNRDVCKPVFVSMGRFEHVKGFDILIRAFQMVLNAIPEAKLWLIGDGTLRNSIEKDIKDRGLTKNVKLWGYQKNPYTIMKDASIYVLSSRNEGLPNALIEALNIGLPLIAVDCDTGPREIITGSCQKHSSFCIEYAQYGILVENHPNELIRAEYLSKAMIDLAKQPGLQDQFRFQAPLRAKDYSIDVYVQKIMKMLASL